MRSRSSDRNPWRICDGSVVLQVRYQRRNPILYGGYPIQHCHVLGGMPQHRYGMHSHFAAEKIKRRMADGSEVENITVAVWIGSKNGKSEGDRRFLIRNGQRRETSLEADF